MAIDSLTDLLEDDEKPKEQSPPEPRSAGTGSHSNNEDKLVAQIEAEDADGQLEDDLRKQATPEAPMRVIGEKKQSWFSIFKRPRFWVLFILALLVAAVFVWLIRPSRLWALNTLGLRAQVTVTAVVAVTEGTPPVIKNAIITANGAEHLTNEQGQVTLSLPYGQLSIVASKPGYEPVTTEKLLDFDPFFHRLGGAQADEAVRNQTLALKNVGVVVGFTAKDWLTGLPITAGNFSVGDITAQPDSSGKVLLTLPATDSAKVMVRGTFAADFTTADVELSLGETDQEATFIPAGDHYFVSKRTGQYAVYSSKLDGSGVAEVVPASAAETGDISFSVSPSGKYGVLASTREATRDSFGSVQQKLYVVDLATKKLTAVDTALRFSLVDWSGDLLVYKSSNHTGSGSTVQRLATLDATQGKKANITIDDTYSVVRVRLGSVMYVRADRELRTVRVTGGTEKSLGSGVKQLVQTSANVFGYQLADNSWHSYDVNASEPVAATTPTSTTRAFLATASANNQTQLVFDTVDGAPTLLAKNVGNGQEAKLFSGVGLSAPIRWVGNVAVYRNGSADYVVSPRGGAPKKITDISPTIAQHDYFTFN